jgi:hypothetical protein
VTLVSVTLSYFLTMPRLSQYDLVPALDDPGTWRVFGGTLYSLKAAGIWGASVRSLRHTFATHSVKRGTSVRVVQKVLGHASRKTTSVYVELAREEMDRQLQGERPITVKPSSSAPFPRTAERPEEIVGRVARHFSFCQIGVRPGHDSP